MTFSLHRLPLRAHHGFAPKSRKDGGPPVAHWSTMTQLTPSSMIFCSAKKKLDYVAVPRSVPKVVDSPKGLKEWPRPGWQCEVDYYPPDEPIRIYDEISEALRGRAARGRRAGPRSGPRRHRPRGVGRAATGSDREAWLGISLAHLKGEQDVQLGHTSRRIYHFGLVAVRSSRANAR